MIFKFEVRFIDKDGRACVVPGNPCDHKSEPIASLTIGEISDGLEKCEKLLSALTNMTVKIEQVN